MTTLRDTLKMPLPTDELETRKLFQDAAAYTASLYAKTIDYTSDSTVDSHNAMILMLTLFHNIIYDYDFTMSAEESINTLLDDSEAGLDLCEIANPNTGIPEGVLPTPDLFNYFDLNWEIYN